jgi:hypothetical protein
MDAAVKPRKVAVGAVVRFAYRGVFGRLELIPEFGWIMVLGLLAAAILPGVLLPGHTPGVTTDLDAVDYLQAAVGMLALSAFAVRWHQHILLGDPRRQTASLFFRGWARFLIYGCILYAAIGAIVAATALVLVRMRGSTATEALVLMAAAGAGWLLLLLTARCALVLPAAARGRPVGIGISWRLMRGNTWRLIWASLLAALPLKLVALALTATIVALVLPPGSDYVIEAPPVGFVILTGVIEAVSDILMAAMGASILAGFYRELATRADNGDTAAQR